MKNLLLIAYHFPPLAGGSGVHRATKFFQYLPENGWTPYVLTTATLAYESVRQAPAAEGYGAPRVTRAFALDARRHLSIKGRYFGWTATPDRWASWTLAAIPKGLALIYRRKISVLVVTFPIATAVLIGLILHRLTGKPLVVDFRDSMTEDTYPRDPRMRMIHRRIEKSIMQHGTRFIFTAESARRMYLDRYPHVAPEKCLVIANGYDEEDFAGLSPKHPAKADEPTRLVHAGLIYPDERDPRPFFRAVSRLKKEGTVHAGNLKIELRASGSEGYYAELIKELGIDDVIHLLPALPHRDALRDIAAADGLLLFQAANCNHQIPAKVYEYLRSGRPILALTAAEGDTAALLNESGGATIADLADENSIYQTLPRFMEQVRQRTHPVADPAKVNSFSRRSQTAVLAGCLDHILTADISSTRAAQVALRS